MSLKKVFWPAFRVVYLVCCVFDVTLLSIWLCPPKDGDFVGTGMVVLAINTLTLVVGWAFLPWPKPEDAPSKPTAESKAPRAVLEDVCGQQGLEDFLEKRRQEGA